MRCGEVHCESAIRLVHEMPVRWTASARTSVISEAIGMPTGQTVSQALQPDHLIRGAYVAAGATFDAAQRLPEGRILAHRGPAVVDEHEVQLFRAVDSDLRLELDVRGARGPGDELRVGADLLTGRAAREQLQDRRGVVERRDDLLHAHDRDVYCRKARRQVGVALVRDEHERAGVRDEDVATSDADIRLQERSSQLFARDRDQRRRVVVDRMPDDLGEERRDLLARLVDRGRDEVRGTLACELDDPLAEVRLDRGDAVCCKVLVELDLLGRHRLRLHHELRLLRAADRGDHPTRLLGVHGAVHLGPDRFCLACESVDERGHVVDRALLPFREICPQARPIDLAHPVGTAQAERRERAMERDPQLVRVERAVELAAELGL